MLAVYGSGAPFLVVERKRKLFTNITGDREMKIVHDVHTDYLPGCRATYYSRGCFLLHIWEELGQHGW